MTVTIWIVLAALLAPFMAVVPLQHIDPVSAMTTSPIVIWTAGILLAIAALVALEDWRLGLFAGYVVLNALRTPFLAKPLSYATTIVIGALAFTLLRGCWIPGVRAVLVASGIVQVVLAACQVLGWDPAWHQQPSSLMVLGTIGHQTMFGAYVAVVGAIAPWWAVPVFVIGVAISGSRLAMAALAVALVVRLWHQRQRMLAGNLALVAGALIIANHRVLFEFGKSVDSYHGRLVAWRVGIEVWWEHFILFGSGPGGWSWFIPQFADRFEQLGATEAFLNPHSIWVGLLFEHGVVGLALALLVVWGHRRTLIGNPVFWALAILSSASFPMFLAQVAAPTLLALAMTWETRRGVAARGSAGQGGAS